MIAMSCPVSLPIFIVLIISMHAPILHAQPYDPLAANPGKTSAPRDLTIHDEVRNREIPIRVYLPETTEPAPAILFSHGLGGSRRACGYLGEHWSARGYVVVFMQHAGSDEAVWMGLPVRERLDALMSATSPASTLSRFSDVKAVLDQLQKWNELEYHQFHGRFDLERIGMSGHSYGASTTQGVSGQSNRRLGQRYTDQRIDAAIMFSPNRPQRGEPKTAFGDVAIPWMLMTGTKDTSPISDTTVDDRRHVYPGLPDTVDKYELVLHDGEHHAFSDGQQSRRRGRNPNHHRVILALSTAFWDTHLTEDDAAQTWLHGDAPRKVMEPKDLWQFHVADEED